MHNKLSDAIVLAVTSHSGQVDKQGVPYIFHPFRVMHAMPPYETLQIAAVLHDVVEDTAVTLEQIRTQFGIAVANLVDAVSRRKGERYTDFIERVIRHSADARAIKIADIEDNLGRMPSLPQFTDLKVRYAKALEQLHTAHCYCIQQQRNPSDCWHPCKELAMKRWLASEKAWRYEFDGNGGYDCTSSAFRIFDGDRLVAVIDVANFMDGNREWDARHERHPDAEAYAKTIVDGMNGRAS